MGKTKPANLVYMTCIKGDVLGPSGLERLDPQHLETFVMWAKTRARNQTKKQYFD
jgi:hypothetical protein